MPAKLIDAGIDYLRVTSEVARQKGRLFDFYAKIRAGDEALGYKEVTGGAFGFVGKKIRHALYGEKKEWAMLQVTGQSAKRGLSLTSEESQATRIDLQLTVRVGEQCVEQVIFDAYAAACDHVRSKARPSKVTLIEVNRHAQTVYIGSRASDVFFRIYDKFEESGKEEYRGCVRYELELKGRMSKAQWQAWASGAQTLATSLQMVIEMFKERGVVLPIESIEDQDIQPLRPSPSSLESTLAWLNRQVAPTVKRLTAEYGYITPFRILFEQALTDLRTHRIMRSLAVVWGS